MQRWQTERQCVNEALTRAPALTPGSKSNRGCKCSRAYFCLAEEPLNKAMASAALPEDFQIMVVSRSGPHRAWPCLPPFLYLVGHERLEKTIDFTVALLPRP
jgi:hypothetical protein